MGGNTVVREGDQQRCDAPFLRSVVESSTIGLLTIDDDGTIVFANPAIEQILGYEPSDLVGSPKHRLLPDRLRPASGGWLEDGRWTGDEKPVRSTVEFPARHRNGHEVPVAVTLTEHEYDSERHYTATVRDISGRSRREERLRERNRDLREFAAVLAHDLRNPLTVAEGYLDLARAERDAEELRQIEDALDRIRQIIDDAETQAMHGRVDGTTEVLPFGDVMQTAWDAVPTAEAELVLPERSWLLRADESRLRQLVENLVRNAVEHAGPAATVRIGILPAGAGFYVEDDGPGLPEDVRAAGGTAPAEDGERPTGYGLRIVETVADEHGWDVQRTAARTGGARFEFHGAHVFEQ